jgi:glucose-1-phosphate cytidylyltransferase
MNAGFFVFNRRVFDYLWAGDCVMEHEPLERLARDGELMAYRHNGFFFAMDTYREYQYLNELWANGKAPWKVWDH